MSCESCAHARMIGPAGWKPSYPGEEYPRYLVREEGRKTGVAHPLWCTLYPKWERYDTAHYCGQWAPVDGLEGVRRREERVQQALEDWRRVTKNNGELRRQLKHAREVSAKRLARLKDGAGE